jgi:hypothetical protein
MSTKIVLPSEMTGGFAQIFECQLMWVVIDIGITGHKRSQEINLRHPDSDGK